MAPNTEDVAARKNPEVYLQDVLENGTCETRPKMHPISNQVQNPKKSQRELFIKSRVGDPNFFLLS